MCKWGVLRSFGIVIPALLIFSSILPTSVSFAGEIKAPLDEMVEKAQADETIKVLAVLVDRVDLAELKGRLNDRNVDIQRRHYEIISSLQDKATEAQGPVLGFLSGLENDGQVKNIRNFWISNIVAFEGTPEAIKSVAYRSDIEYVEYDLPVELIEPVKSGAQSRPLTASHAEGLDIINAPAVWDLGYTGSGRIVSNIDTGVDGSHPALSSRWRGNNGYPASECWYDPVGSTTYPEDYGRHGTHTMGTICGRSATTYDTVGVAMDAQWIACASIDNGSTESDIIASFEFIADPDGDPATTDDVPDVVSNSWGWSPLYHGVEPCDDTFWSVMDACEEAGVAVVFAAGNEGDYGASTLRTPADRATTIYNAFAVGAIDGHTSGYPIADFSSLGPSTCGSGELSYKPECVAPGVDIYSCIPEDSYSGDWSGTSMACPHIAGAVALIKQANPALTVDEVKEIIIQSCVDLGDTGEDNTYGHGYLDLLTAVQMAATGLGWIDGYVRDNTYNTPLPATVSIIGGSTSTVADDQGYFILAASPDTTYTIMASYTGYGDDQKQITVTLDDTVSNDFYLAPPIIDYSPASYNVQAAPGDSAIRDLYISNTGEGSIIYSLGIEVYDMINSETGEITPVQASIRKARPEPLGYRANDSSKPGSSQEPYYPPVITGEGGPDSYGYTWIDSDEDGGPSVNWVDISESGTTVSLDDDDYVSASIGFSFPFYDNSYTSLYITSNGFVCFGNSSDEYLNKEIPNTYDPDNFIAALWDDLVPHRGGEVMYYYDSSEERFVVSWTEVPFHYNTGEVNCQIVLYQNGTIDLNYGSLDGGTHGLNSATVGIENSDGTDGLQVAYNQTYLESNMSIRISSGYWLSVSPSSGSISAGTTDTIEVLFDAAELAEGIYYGNLNLNNNSPNNPEIDIPVTFHVTDTSTPIIGLNISEVYDTLYTGHSTDFYLIIENSGDSTLTYSLTDDRDWISASLDSGDVDSGDNDSIIVTLDAAALEEDDYTGTITVNSNDPNDSTIDIPVYLHVDLLITTDVGVTDIIDPPDSMSTDSEYPVSVEITNFGTEPQTFEVVFEAYYLNGSTPVYTDNITITDMPDSSVDEYSFSSNFTPDIDTAYTIVAYTTLSGDQVPDNDSYQETVYSYSYVTAWYGNLDLLPVTAEIGDTFMVDVYVSTPVNAYIGGMHLCLGYDDTYIAGGVSETQGVIYSPLTEWTEAYFTGPYGVPPNDEGWSSESFIGDVGVSLTLDENPWFNSTVPVHLLSFALIAVDNDSFIGETVTALSYGLNPEQGPSNAGDTLGLTDYSPIEYFSQVQFTEGTTGCDFVPGDANGSGIASSNDVVYLVNYLRGTGNPPLDSCWNESNNSWLYSAADCNGTCDVKSSDVIYLVNYFRGRNDLRYCPETPPMNVLSVSGDDTNGNDGSNNSRK